MFHILLVSEDRLLLKKLYPMLEDNSRYCIHVVPFSMDAFETAKKYHTDIAIIDTEVFLPYENILSQLETLQWPINILLLSNETSLSSSSKNLYCAKRSNIQREEIKEKMERIIQNIEKIQNTDVSFVIEWNGVKNCVINADTYHLIYVKSFDGKINSSSIAHLNNSISSYAKAQIISSSPDELVTIIGRNNLKSLFTFTKLSQDIFSSFSENCAILYKKSINSSKVFEELMELKYYKGYSYFFNSSSFNFSKDKISTECNEKILHTQCQQLLATLLIQDKESASNIIRDLYLKTIKNSVCIQTKEYIRMQIKFFFYIFNGEIFDFNFECAEDEMNAILNSNIFSHNDYHSKKVQNCILITLNAIYNGFQNNINLEDISQKTDRNKIYLTRIYKEYFNITILETLQFLRLEHAKYYLANTKYKVSDIASLTGFNDIGYFSKFFHHETGMTALEYRNKN